MIEIMSSKNRPSTQFNIFGELQPLPLSFSEEPSKTKEVIMIESTILFAKKGYKAVSIRDIANHIGIKPSSLYNHFSGKEALFDTVLKHAEDLYLLYFKRLDEMLAETTNFSDFLDLIFLDPSKMTNTFTCYAFSLIMTEQFRDERSAMIFNNTFLDYSINFLKNWFDRCISNGMAAAFDTRTIATLIMHSILISINLKVHEFLDRNPPYSYSELFKNLKQMILRLSALTESDDGPNSPPDLDEYGQGFKKLDIGLIQD
jgi:AcrR family transcriptional regulator